MISCIIVDDEPRNVDVLSKLVTDFCKEIKVIGTASSVDEACILIKEKNQTLCSWI